MHRRSLLTVAVAAAALVACAPSIEKPAGNPASTDFVVFDPATSQIPLPNDLALQTAATAQGAQGELLRAFVAQGGFPNDQEVPITIDVQRFTYGGSTPEKVAPPVPVAPATLILFPSPNATIAVFEKKPPATPGAPAPAAVPVDPATLEVKYVPPAATSASGPTDRGTITIENKLHAVTLSPGDVIQSRRWNAGSQYVVLVRGGANGVKLQVGGALTAMPTMFFLTQGQDLSLPQNQYLLPGDGRQGRAATGLQLETIRQGYIKAGLIQGPTSPGAAELVFGAGATKDLLSIQTFQVAAAPAAGAPSTFVVTDASAGVVPLPSDLLLDPATNKIVNNPAFGGLAAGIATLDGFSTTAMELSQTTAPVVAGTVTKDTVFLYDLSNPAAPVRLKEVKEGPTTAGFVAEPFQVTQKPTSPTTFVPCTAADDPAGCFSTAIGLQPAVPIPLNPAGTLFAALPPLKEGTEYAVLITDGVKDTAAQPLQRSTLSRILLFDNALVDAGGKSQLTGQPDATAGGLEKIRQGVGAAAAALQAEKGTTKEHIVLGYTFRTQTITGTALKLAAAPYLQAAAIVPQAPHVYANLTEVLAAYPAPPGFDVANITVANIQEIMDVPVPTLNAISNTTGALEPDNTKWTPNLVTAIVVVPNPVKVTTPCPGTSGLKCAPLVIFHHGFNDQRSDVLAMADALAGKGFVVASIDAPYHGDRTPCASTADCAVGTCVAIPGGEGQGDVAPPLPPPGLCKKPDGTPGKPLPAITGQRYFISGNLFRTRDGLRQDIIDQSSLVLALARPPTLPQVTSPLATRLAATYGLAVDPSKVYWVGQSLGAIQGTTNVAVNSRFSKAVLNVGGATTVDSLINSPTYSGRTDPTTPPAAGSLVGLLLASQKITFGTAGYLQFVNVAKWVLDPAEPLNFAKHLVAAPLPDPLSTTGAAQQQKKIFGQIAKNDQTIANPQNLELYGNIFGPIGLGTSNSVPLYTASGGGDASHGFLLDFTDNATTLAGQSDAAEFLLNDALPTTATRP